MSAKTLMIQGTGSSVGKSLIVTALCRIFKRKGVRVAPFKSQNMSLNSFITAEGHEMGRAQVAQAEAAGLVPSSLMNPVLLKPTADHTSQVIVNGRVRATMSAPEYYKFRHTLRTDIMDSFTTLAAQNELILIEGAGSPAEINLRENDLANMGMAAMADAPVVLVGDIDRGGVFASLYGTVKLLEEEEQRRIRGFVINKFRGDIGILEPGLRQLEDLLRQPVLGVLPYWNVRIDEEDSLTERLNARSNTHNGTGNRADLDIAVLRLPRLSNFTDFAVFDTLPDVCLRYAGDTATLGSPDLVIIPGSKNTLEDMQFLTQSGLARKILELHAQGVPVVGVCGGYQMLGRMIYDPLGAESSLTEVPGLNLLPMTTTFAPHKQTTQTQVHVQCSAGILQGTSGMVLNGYEIHMGQSRADTAHTADSGHPPHAPLGNTQSGTAEGTVNSAGSVIGTYLHGLFDNMAFTRALLNNLRLRKGLSPLALEQQDYASFREAEYNRLADMVEGALDMPELERIIGLKLG